MTPEQRGRLENNWLPLCAMDPDDREALKESDAPWMFLSASGRWNSNFSPVWDDGRVYRLAPQPKCKPVVQWQFIHEDIVSVTMNHSGKWFLHTKHPEMRASYWVSKGRQTGVSSELVGPGLLIDPGDLTADDWKESLMIRPGYGQSE